MGSLSPVASVISAVTQGIGLASSFSRNEMVYRTNQDAERQALQQLQERQALSEQQAAQQANLDRQNIAAQAQTAEENRRTALKRAVARQRAQFGGGGIAQGTGSSQAVLLGLYNESEAELAQRERLDNLRYGAIDQNLSQQRSLNVLQYEQLKQRQKLNNLTSNYDRANSYLDLGAGLFGALDRAGDVIRS